jgi:3-oxoadipate CoA-transferase alpha subunit
MIDKFVRSMAEAMNGIRDGATVLIAGFGDVGAPNALLDGLIEQGAIGLVLETRNPSAPPPVVVTGVLLTFATA